MYIWDGGNEAGGEREKRGGEGLWFGKTKIKTQNYFGSREIYGVFPGN